MTNSTYKKLEVIEIDLDNLDQFEFEDHDDLREFFEDSDKKDLLL